MTDEVAVDALVRYGELILTGVIALVATIIGFLVRRTIVKMDAAVIDVRSDIAQLQVAVHGNDNSEGLRTRMRLLEGRAEDHEDNLLKLDSKLLQVADSIGDLTSLVGKQAVNGAREVGDLKAGLARIEGILKGMTNEDKR